MLSCLLIGAVLVLCVRANSFPSLLTTNATLAIVIDKEFVAEDYDNIKSATEKFIAYLKREILRHGGVNVQYFSWTNINVKRDITAILSIAPCSDTWQLFKAADRENILHMAISESDCPRLPLNQAITIPLIKRGEEMPQMLLDLRSVNAYDWKAAIILFDESLDRDMITRILTSITKDTSDIKAQGTAVSLVKLDTNSTKIRNLRNILSTISTKIMGSNFLVVVSTPVVSLIMEVAKSLKLVDTQNQWLYVISDVDYEENNITTLKTYLQEGDNVAFVYNITKSDPSCKGGLQCHTEEILQAFSRGLEQAIMDEFELASQVSDEEWEAIRPSKQERRSYLISSIKAYLLQHGECDNCTTWQLQAGETWGRDYKLPSGFSAKLLQVGYWRPSDGPTLTDALFPHVAHGFRGKTLPLVSFHNPPWQILQTNKSGSLVSYKGLVFDIINALAKSLNFTYTVEVAKDNFESRHASKSNITLLNDYQTEEITTYTIPDAIIAMVRKKQVAFTACVFTITDHSKIFVNFTIPVSTQSYTFLVARPKELSRALLFMSPFTKDTWLCLSATIITMGPILFYIHKLSPVHEYKGIRQKGGLSTIQNCIWYMYGALLQQGGMYLPYADSARLIVGSWWLVVLVLSTTYCGNLVAFLTFPKNDKPVTTIDELLTHRDTMTWSLVPGSFFENELKVSKESRHQSLYQGAIKEKRNKDDMITDIENGKHVLIDWKIRLQYIMKKQVSLKNRCELSLGTDEFFDEQLGLVVSQDNPYVKIINKEIKRLHQVGLTQKWLKDYLPKRDKCFNTRNAAVVNNHTVNLDDMQGSFFVLIFGFTLAFVWICLEKLWHKYKLKQEKKAVQPFAS